MSYDSLNRPLTKTYTNNDNTTNTTPSLTLNYDETTRLGVSLMNTNGRNSSSFVAGSQAAEVYSYDELGRVKNNSQCTPQNCAASTVFPINYSYDLLGDTLTVTNGMGVTFTYGAYNRALRITGLTSSLSDSNHPGTLYSAAHYNAVGSATSASIGNPGSSIGETRVYDGRLRLCAITDGVIYKVGIPSNTLNQCQQGSINGYAPDGEIVLANDSVNGNWTYSYDAFNRLAAASATGQGYSYAYDRFGNRWQQNGPHSAQPGFDANNHIVGLGMTYDAAGNETNDGTSAYTYDSENRIISAVNNSTGTSSYQYGADGRRIRKATAAAGTVDFLYDLSGHEIAQVTSSGGWTRGEIYAGGRHLGTYTGGASGNTYFTFADWLGTERARSVAGVTTACETITNIPFGDWLTAAGSCGDPSPMHFTGKERDSESGIDYFGARYYASNMGRWTSPDPSGLLFAAPSNPQSFNLGAYVENNPINGIDTDGRLTIIIPGTWWDYFSASDWNDHNPLFTEATILFNEQQLTWIDPWSPSGDNDKDRSAAAAKLANFINNYKFQPGEQLNIVAHSHGGNVALLAAGLGLNHPINNLVTLGTPFGYATKSSGVKNWYNVTGSGDDVQPKASHGCWTTAGCSQQQGAQNHTVESGGHSTLWTDQSVRERWERWIQGQQSAKPKNITIIVHEDGTMECDDCAGRD